MPGGSVNGRPFRESADSYSKTGIPCGNPKRFQSREVIRMGMQKPNFPSKPLVGPVENIETEGDRQLQSLLKKQLNTKITIQEQFKQHKQFSEAVSHQASTDLLCGIVSLKKFKDISKLDNYVMELKQCGLTEEEIELKLESDGEIGSKRKKMRLNLEPEVREDKLMVINNKIAAKKRELEKPDSFSGAKVMGRHEMELEKSISHNNGQAKITQCLLRSTRSGVGSENSADPMDHLPEILDLVTKQQHKAKEVKSTEHVSTVSDQGIGESCGGDLQYSSDICLQESKLGKRVEYGPVNHKDFSSQNETQKGSCAMLSEVLNSGPRTLEGSIVSVAEEDIIRDRLSLEEIKAIPRFKDYTPGEPSKVLYVKNLPTKISEEDLVSLFIRFQDPEGPHIVFKLMTGRMRGQAFITFDSVKKATAAMELLNGYRLKERPIIIQYGKKTSSEKLSD